ncbi:MAG: hypothetical protein JXA77_00570 [Bacteroidales bacterium]|nr:hypothetical protein [Bacteroidales bacterium]
MRIINKITTGIAKQLILALCIAIAFTSCETEDYFDTANNADFELPEVAYAEESIILTGTTNESSEVLWEVSDGSFYNTNSVEITFSNSGIYEISHTVLCGGNPVHRVTKKISVLNKTKLIQSEKVFVATNQISDDPDNIVFEGYFDGESQKAFLILDSKLQLVGSTYNLNDFNLSRLVESYLPTEINHLLNYENNTTDLSDLKSASVIDLYKGKANNFRSGFFAYGNGYIMFYQLNTGEINIDFLNKDYNTLWSMPISTEGRTLQQFMFNMNDKLYHLSFDNTNDKLYINKFKNISLSYQHTEVDLDISADDRIVLFASQKKYQGKISLGIYSVKENKTFIYEINENCETEIISQFEGLTNINPLILFNNGSVIAKQENELVKYNNNWQPEYSLQVNNGNFGISQMGENLNLLFENTSEGLRLAYLNKNLEYVPFE